MLVVRIYLFLFICFPNSYLFPKELYVDTKSIDSKEVEVGTSGASVTLHWNAQAGEHSYTVKVYRLVDGQELWEDSWNGKISVRNAYQQFAVKLEAFPTELEGGGTVFFTVKAWNFANQAIPLSGFVEDEKGAIVKSIDGLEGRVPGNAQNYTLTAFSLDVYGVGNHTYKLFLDNADGEPNGAGEEHWSEVTMEVTPWKADMKLECDSKVVLNKDDVDNLDCTLYLLRRSPNNSVQVKISEIVVGGARFWPSSFKEVNLSKDVLQVTPNDPDDDTHIKITIDEKFAEFYFGIDPLVPWHSYVDKLATEQPWEIVINFENAPSISTTFRILKNDDISPEDVAEYGGSATFVLSEILGKIRIHNNRGNGAWDVGSYRS